jgi:hypothetical protein
MIRQGWKYKCGINKLLNQEGKDDWQCAREVLDKLKASKLFEDDMESAEAIAKIEEAIEFQDLELFNDALDDIYDIADEKRIWMYND